MRPAKWLHHLVTPRVRADCRAVHRVPAVLHQAPAQVRAARHQVRAVAAKQGVLLQAPAVEKTRAPAVRAAGARRAVPAARRRVRVVRPAPAAGGKPAVPLPAQAVAEKLQAPAVRHPAPVRAAVPAGEKRRVRAARRPAPAVRAGSVVHRMPRWNRRCRLTSGMAMSARSPIRWSRCRSVRPVRCRHVATSNMYRPAITRPANGRSSSFCMVMVNLAMA